MLPEITIDTINETPLDVTTVKAFTLEQPSLMMFSLAYCDSDIEKAGQMCAAMSFFYAALKKQIAKGN